MRIGLTCDLRDRYLARGFSAEAASEFDEIETIDAVAAAIAAVGHEVERIGDITDLVDALAAGRRWPLVWNMCEGVSGIAREAQVPALLEAWGIPVVFSPAEVLVTTMDKSLAKLVVRAAGVPTPDFAVVRSAADAEALQLPFPLFVKPLAEGTSKGIRQDSLVADRAALTARCGEVLAGFAQPALVEAYLPGREFTVGLLGTAAAARVIGTCEIGFRPGADPDVYSWRNKAENLEELRLADDATAREAAVVALAAWRALGGRDAGRIDLRCDADGQPQFIECNTLPGLRPGWSELPLLAAMAGMDYGALIAAILAEALPRALSGDA